MARPEQSRAGRAGQSSDSQRAAGDGTTTLGWDGDGVGREEEWRVVGAVHSTIIAFAVGGLPQASGELPKKFVKNKSNNNKERDGGRIS